nr:uncharacterized mitochondrial protein AtMg00810-like [Tanacetum cinerariifolium]
MSKKQDYTAMSLVEAEYVALSVSCTEVMWMRTQLQEYGFSTSILDLSGELVDQTDYRSKIRSIMYLTSSRPDIMQPIVQLILFIVDSGCTKHMTGNLMLLCNFVEKYLGNVCFGNDQFATILGYVDLVQGNITINRVYYVKGLNHNLFSVGQFCDADLEVAFQKSTCFVRDLHGNDLLTVESIHIRFDEIKEMLETFVANDTSGYVLQRQKASEYENSDPVPQQQNVSSLADTNVPSQQELDLLFGPLYDEFFTAEDEQLQEDEFTNPFYTPVYEVAESSLHNTSNSNVHIFNQPQVFEYRWIKEHSLEKVCGNPSKPVQTRRKLATDLEMCMFTLTDADHAGCIDTRKGTSGGIQFLGDKLDSWMSKKQDCTLMSSAEAKHVALSASCAQVMWIRTQLQDYGFNYNKIPSYCDSQSAIAISCNPVHHSRNKHIHTR